MQEEKTIDLTLSIQEVNALLQILGDMPTKTGVYPLLKKIEGQGREQLELPSKE